MVVITSPIFIVVIDAIALTDITKKPVANKMMKKTILKKRASPQ